MSVILALAALIAPVPPCTAATAVATTIEAIQADYPAWEGRCVRIRGIGAGRRLLADRDALLEDAGGFGEDARHSIILMRPRGGTLAQTPSLIEVTGTVNSCKTANESVAAMEAEHPEQIIMISGYCHTSLETYVTVASIRTLSTAPIARLTEAEVPAERRDLTELPAEYASLRERYGAAAQRMLAALATRDETAFRRLAAPDAQNEIDTLGLRGIGDGTRDDVRRAHRDFLAAQALQAPARAILRRGAAPPYLLATRDALLELREQPGDSVQLLACWCKLNGDCAGKWPVLPSDNDNRPERPYLCLPVGDYTIYPDRDAIQVTAPVGTGRGFAEPKW